MHALSDDMYESPALDTVDWAAVHAAIDAYGYAALPGLFVADACRAMASLYARRELFRSRVVMARHGFGSGEYQYFRYPLPSSIDALRSGVYPHLVPLANRWNEAMDIGARYPPEHGAFVEQ